MNFRCFKVFIAILLTFFSVSWVNAATKNEDRSFVLSSPFPSALETLQKQIGYTFKNIALLKRAMTHASFSEENNKALSILGGHVIESSVSLYSLEKDIDISAKDLNQVVLEISKVEASCTIDGMQLGLEKVVRVSPKTNSSAPIVVCSAFRAIFGAIALDTGKSDDAGNVFLKVHGRKVGRGFAM
ncbi:hypothetical protein SLEP1_g29220 [Rubroshorea leprosula]|uniref:RNase III domain-containing protein n=1 Tax=Rubroshorea leprosula TaxID=152421 RepID=A0AAV5K5C4_9ROSI|nr:hypothetical protein SLEP1_g29220 [Rubroshorea leprosula]